MVFESSGENFHFEVFFTILDGKKVYFGMSDKLFVCQFLLYHLLILFEKTTLHHFHLSLILAVELGAR